MLSIQTLGQIKIEIIFLEEYVSYKKEVVQRTVEGGYSKLSIIRLGRSRLLEFEKKIVLVV